MHKKTGPAELSNSQKWALLVLLLEWAKGARPHPLAREFPRGDGGKARACKRRTWLSSRWYAMHECASQQLHQAVS